MTGGHQPVGRGQGQVAGVVVNSPCVEAAKHFLRFGLQILLGPPQGFVDFGAVSQHAHTYQHRRHRNAKGHGPFAGGDLPGLRYRIDWPNSRSLCLSVGVRPSGH